MQVGILGSSLMGRTGSSVLRSRIEFGMWLRREFFMVTLTVNGVRHEVQAPGDTPLLYVLRNDLELSCPQFGCGLSQCGACSVLIDGKESRSCVLPLNRVAGKEITTLEGLPVRWATQQGLPASEAGQILHP